MPSLPDPPSPEPPVLPPGVLCARLGPGANCSSAGSAIDILFYGSVLVGALAVALAAAIPPAPPDGEGDGPGGPGDGPEGGAHRGPAAVETTSHGAGVGQGE